jgi:hypothetical protein
MLLFPQMPQLRRDRSLANFREPCDLSERKPGPAPRRQEHQIANGMELGVTVFRPLCNLLVRHRSSSYYPAPAVSGSAELM